MIATSSLLGGRPLTSNSRCAKGKEAFLQLWVRSRSWQWWPPLCQDRERAKQVPDVPEPRGDQLEPLHRHPCVMERGFHGRRWHIEEADRVEKA